MYENIVVNASDAGGCPVFDSRELLEISRESACRNYWYSDNVFPENGAIFTDKKKVELRHYLSKQVAPIAYACPCANGEPIDITQGVTVKEMGFAYYKNWVSLDPCEVEEEVIILEDQTPYEKVPYLEKYSRHVVAKTAALTEAVRTRYELMSTFLVLYGSYTVFGPKMDDQFVDYQRRKALTVTLMRNYQEIDSFPMEDLSALFNMFRINTMDLTGGGGAVPESLTFGVDAWNDFHQHHLVQKFGFVSACNCTEPGNNLGIQSNDCGIEFAGTLKGLPVYIDGRVYIDVDGVNKYYMPSDAMLIRAAGFSGRRAHSTIYSPSANFAPGDFHFRETFCEKQEVWTLEVQGSIAMFPGNVNRNMLVRNVGRAVTFPGKGSQNRLLNPQGEVMAPPNAGKGQANDSGQTWEEALQAAVDNNLFSILTTLAGRGAPRVPCNNGTAASCVPGKWIQILPSTDPCPSAAPLCISKDTLRSQGFSDLMIADAIFHGGLEVQTDAANCEGVITQPGI